MLLLEGTVAVAESVAVAVEKSMKYQLMLLGSESPPFGLGLLEAGFDLQRSEREILFDRMEIYKWR